jgi:hypothetical protein
VERKKQEDLTEHRRPEAKKTSGLYESSEDENEQGESQTSCRRIARIDEQSKTEKAKNQVIGSKNIKLEPERDQKTGRKSSRNRSAQEQTKEKYEPT